MAAFRDTKADSACAQDDIEGDKFGLKQFALTAFTLLSVDFAPFLEFLIPPASLTF